jgi:hypothetical protein
MGLARALSGIAASACLISSAEGQDTMYWADPYNGYLIYVSPSSHYQAVGARGECLGESEDNINFYVGWSSIHSDYYNDAYAPTHSGRNFLTRGYDVVFGQGTNQEKINNSNYFGANIHLPMHSNARDIRPPPCGSTNTSGLGTWVLYRQYNTVGQNLAEFLRDALAAVSPGTGDRVCSNPPLSCSTTDLGELRLVNATAAYVESEFHDWDIGVAWLHRYYEWAWRFGVGVDQHLGYPQPRQQ